MAGQDRGPDPFRQRRGGASELHLRPAPKRARRLQGLALRGKQELSLTQYQIALMFTLQLGDVRRASARIRAVDQTRYHSLVHYARSWHPGCRIIPCSPRFRLHADVRGRRSGRFERCCSLRSTIPAMKDDSQKRPCTQGRPVLSALAATSKPAAKSRRRCRRHCTGANAHAPHHVRVLAHVED